MDKKQKNNDISHKIRPLADRVLIKELDVKGGTSTKSGIIIPETVGKDSSTHRGKVVAVGEGRYEDGKLVPVKVKVGDEVLYQWGDKIVVEGEEYYIVNESSVLAVLV
jgi:chaperonin GroES